MSNAIEGVVTLCTRDERHYEWRGGGSRIGDCVYFVLSSSTVVCVMSGQR